MINMNINEIKKLKFGVAVSGVQTRDLSGTLRLFLDGIEYGFPTTVLDDKILVTIPDLQSVVKSGLKEGRVIKAVLDVKIGDTILQPWADSIKLTAPIQIEATISEEENIKKTETTIKLNLEDDISEKVIKKQPKKKATKKTRMSKIFEEKK